MSCTSRATSAALTTSGTTETALLAGYGSDARKRYALVDAPAARAARFDLFDLQQSSINARTVNVNYFYSVREAAPVAPPHSPDFIFHFVACMQRCNTVRFAEQPSAKAL